MKKIISITVLACCSFFVIQAQQLTGSYEQVALSAPKEFKQAKKDLLILQDSKHEKMVWVHNLLPERFYAVVHSKNDEKLIYSIPEQQLSNYTINLGCIIFDEEDERVVISLNNKSDCFGMSSDDLGGEISVSKKGVKSDKVKVGSDGSIETENVKVKNGQVKVNTKSVFEGIQYIGTKN